MRFPALAARSVRRLLPLLAGALFVTALAGPVAAQPAGTPASTETSLVAQQTTTSSTPATGQTTDSSATTSGPSDQAVQPGQTAIVSPPEAQVPLNPGWTTDQMDVRVMPEYDAKAVLVIIGFSLPADVPLPATLKFPIPTGATIAGIGEVDPNGNFNYNYADSYPSVEPGSEWDIATIEVKDYRQLQVDYYYDPGLPQGAGQRSFPLLAQMPMDAGTLVLHVQQPGRATDFEVQPILEGSGQADDGFTYFVAAYPEVKAGSTLGHLVSYYKPDGGLSIDSDPSASAQSNTNTVLLAAILVIVVIVGGLVVYRLYSNSRSGSRRNSRQVARRSTAGTAPQASTKRQRQGGKALPSKGATPKGTSPKGATPRDTPTTEPAPTDDATTERGDEDVEYCNACGEELTTDSPFCPKCGEARP